MTSFFATLVASQTKKTEESLAAELKLPETPAEEIITKTKDGVNKKKKIRLEPELDYDAQMQQEQAIQEKDISCELRKLIALNFPALMHTLCPACADDDSSSQDSFDGCGPEEPEEHKSKVIKKTLKTS